jgi:hypothetical protein
MVLLNRASMVNLVTVFKGGADKCVGQIHFPSNFLELESLCKVLSISG